MFYRLPQNILDEEFFTAEEWMEATQAQQFILEEMKHNEKDTTLALKLPKTFKALEEMGK